MLLIMPNKYSTYYSLKNPCNRYVLLWMLYFLQGLLFPQGGAVGRLIIVLFLSLSLYHFFKANTVAGKPVFFRAINLLVIIISVYGVIRIVGGVDIYRSDGVLQNPTIFIKNYCISLLPIYAMYNYCREGYIDENWLFAWSFVFLAYLIVRFYSSYFMALQSSVASGFESDILTNNAGYLFVSFMCLLPVLSRKPIIQYSMVVLCGLFVIQSAKRGAVICFAICLIVLIIYNLRSANKSKKVIIIALSLAGLFGVFAYFNHMITTNMAFANRFVLSIENSSGRDDLYIMFIQYLKNDLNLFTFLFGKGADATIILSGNFAHNDWLEFAVDMGLLGVFAYSFFFVRFYKLIKCSSDNMARLIALMLFLPFVLKSVFSMAIGDFQIFECAALAICLKSQSGLSIHEKV